MQALNSIPTTDYSFQRISMKEKEIAVKQSANAEKSALQRSAAGSQNHEDIATFYQVMKYLVALRRSGCVKDESFALLARYATANFIEAELERKISQVFDVKFTPSKLMKYL